MSEGFIDETLRLPSWLIRLCKWCWRWHRFFFGTIVFSILLNVIAALPLVDPSTFNTVPIEWIFSHVPLFLSILIFFILWTTFCGLIARLGVPLSERDLRRAYLSRIVSERELVTLQGIPAGLIAQSVRLTDIFIPPQFRPNRPLVDFPLSEQELDQYRRYLKHDDAYSPELERVVFEAEKNWQHNILQQNDRVGIAEIWKRLSKDRAVVIQGYPGMGKSTLMERLMLHMAARGLRRPDPAMPEQEQLVPVVLPILLRLGEYATTCTEMATLSLSDYLGRVIEEKHLPGPTTFIQSALQNGSCLVMLDGLDEVSEPGIRRQVQEQIKTFIKENFSNRFLITSRVAGYEQGAFPAYPHFTLAELNDQQITDFLPRWCRANLAWDRGISTSTAMQDTSIEQEVKERVGMLEIAVHDNPGVQKLAENPLLLTLLVVMQQNSIVLPRQRVELYDVVTRTLLENRNIAKHLRPVSEFQAIQRLGPLAFQMQETNNSFAHKHEVEEKLIEVIRQAGGTDAEANAEMQSFLLHVRERGGLFASRVGDYFGFSHRTFQEYFAARFILNHIKIAQQEWIDRLVELACRRDALWREPFLLAVAYQSKENELIANAILRALLEKQGGNSFEQVVYNLLLTVEATIEAKELTVDATLQIQCAERLLSAYERAQRLRTLVTCQLIENTLQRWLLSLPKETYRLPPPLSVIAQTIKNSGDLVLQRATLTLLASIASRLEPCSAVVFETLIPLLLALTGLPALGFYHPSQDLSITTDFDVADQAIGTLLFLNKRGLGGLYLPVVQQYFDEHPEQLRRLARYSLECRTLITPTFLPLANETYQHYESAIGQWKRLCDRSTSQGITDRHIDACQDIHKTLLACAEEVNYPISVHLLTMLQRTEHQANQPWLLIWQNYLLEQINTGNYLSYQQAIFLWNALFPGSQLQPLVNTILNHYTTSDLVRQRYAQRFLSTFSSTWLYVNDMLKLRYFVEWMNLRDMSYSRYLIYARYLRYLRYPNYLTDLSFLRYLRYLNWELRDLRDLRDLKELSYLMNFLDLSTFSNWRDLLDLYKMLFKKETLEIAQEALTTAEQRQKIDLLHILEARILLFQLEQQSGPEIEGCVARNSKGKNWA